MALETFEYIPENVCSKQYKFEFDGDKIVSVKIIRGCPGNTQGLSKLMEGRSIDDVISALSGIRCPGSKTGMTSCPDQISKALQAYKTKKN